MKTIMNLRAQAWASAGKGKGGLLPPPLAGLKKYYVFRLFLGKNSIFFVVF